MRAVISLSGPVRPDIDTLACLTNCEARGHEVVAVADLAGALAMVSSGVAMSWSSPASVLSARSSRLWCR
jgi:hypothetical protein